MFHSACIIMIVQADRIVIIIAPADTVRILISVKQNIIQSVDNTIIGHQLLSRLLSLLLALTTSSPLEDR